MRVMGSTEEEEDQRRKTTTIKQPQPKKTQKVLLKNNAYTQRKLNYPPLHREIVRKCWTRRPPVYFSKRHSYGNYHK